MIETEKIEIKLNQEEIFAILADAINAQECKFLCHKISGFPSTEVDKSKAQIQKCSIYSALNRQDAMEIIVDDPGHAYSVTVECPHYENMCSKIAKGDTQGIELTIEEK